MTTYYTRTNTLLPLTAPLTLPFTHKDYFIYSKREATHSTLSVNLGQRLTSVNEELTYYKLTLCSIH